MVAIHHLPQPTRFVIERNVPAPTRARRKYQFGVAAEAV